MQLIMRGDVNKCHVTSLARWMYALKIFNRANANVSISLFRRANCRSVPPECSPERNYLCINSNIRPFDYIISNTLCYFIIDFEWYESSKLACVINKKDLLFAYNL